MYPKDIVLLDRYINGHSLKKSEMKDVKKALSMTVITSKNDKKARNKPIITGAVNNIRTKVFLDSGADINIVCLLYTSPSPRD